MTYEDILLEELLEGVDNAWAEYYADAEREEMADALFYQNCGK